MSEASDPSGRKAKQWQRRATVFVFIFAITWGLPAFFNWIFLGATLYCYALSLLHRPRVHEERPNYRTAHRPQTHQTSAERSQALAKKIVIGIAVTIFGIFFLLFLIGLFVGEDDAYTYDAIPDEYQEKLKKDPNNVEALAQIGNSYLEDFQYDSALAYYNRALAINATNSAVLYNVGLVHYNTQQYDESIVALKKCLEAEPNYANAFLIMGHNYYDRQRYDEAFTWYTKAYDAGIENAFLSHVLAYLYDNKGNTSRAITLYREALKLDSSRTEIYSRLAEIDPGNATLYKRLEQQSAQ